MATVYFHCLIKSQMFVIWTLSQIVLTDSANLSPDSVLSSAMEAVEIEYIFVLIGGQMQLGSDRDSMVAKQLIHEWYPVFNAFCSRSMELS